MALSRLSLSIAFMLLRCWGIQADRNDPHPSKSWKRREEEAFSLDRKESGLDFVFKLEFKPTIPFFTRRYMLRGHFLGVVGHTTG